MKNLIALSFIFLISFTQTYANDTIPTIGDRIVLTDHNNKKFDSKNLEGKYLMVFFGFTRCPDVCPLGLSKMMSIHKSLKNKKSKVVPIFITIDPERDNPQTLKPYVSAFGDSLIGLTGPEKKLDDTLKKFRGYSKKLKSKGNAEYLMEHSDIIYVMDKKGKYLRHFTSSSKVKDMISYMNKEVK